MGSYDQWKATPDGERWERREEAETVPSPKPACFDCGCQIRSGGTSVPVCGNRFFCRPCAVWRAARLLTFDERSKSELTREVA